MGQVIFSGGSSRWNRVGSCLGLNPRQYRRHFQSSILDWLVPYLLDKAYPLQHTFTLQDYLHFFDPDFGKAFKNWATTLAFSCVFPTVLFVEGMWGGYRSISRARPYLLSKLLSSTSAARNLAAKLPIADENRRLRVGIHYRSGDFGSEYESGLSRWNRRLPLRWYAAVAETFTRQFGDNIEIVFVTDADQQEVKDVFSRYPMTTTSDQTLTQISDMLLLASCDVIIPSLSSFSLAALFLGSAYYVWPREHLVEFEHFLTLWGDEELQTTEKGPTMMNIRSFQEKKAPLWSRSSARNSFPRRRR